MTALRCVPTTFTVLHGPAWDAWESQAHYGDVTIVRVGRGDADEWAVRRDGDRLHRRALKWRKEHPETPITHPDERNINLSPEHAAILKAFDYEPQPSSRTDAWKRNHTFTFAEALYVCGAATD